MTRGHRRRGLAPLCTAGVLAVLIALSLGRAPALTPGALRILDGGQIHGWERRDFKGSTRYRTEVLNDEPVLRAEARGDASGLYLTRAVKLAGTPRLRWRWRVRAALDNPAEKSRGGDDFVARVYVVTTDPVMFWRTRAICYVWASSAAVGETWVNPYADGVKMLALQSGSSRSGRWVSESRDVAQDFQRLFGAVPERIDVVAIMTDTDNTGLGATAWYDDLEWGASPSL